MDRYHFKINTHKYFEGWYLKHQSLRHTLILIPSWHKNDDGTSYGSLQIIFDDRIHTASFSADDCHIARDRFYVRLGQNIFTEKGCRLHVDLPQGQTIRGHLYYGKWHIPLHSFMGPFRYLPLPCRHDVLSLSHRLRGRIQVENEIWDFQNGTGYIEKDWGYEFPAHYLWIQGNEADTSSPTSFMLTIAELSRSHRHFLACSSLLRHDGKQYRLSTDQGARLHRYGSRRIDMCQGPYRLQIILPPEPTTVVPLLAPQDGTMNRVIEEHPRCPIRCQLFRANKLIFDQVCAFGSYELA